MTTVWRLMVGFVLLQSVTCRTPPIENIAQGRAASMSSTIQGFDATRAVDGNTKAVYPGGIINTIAGRNFAWWKVYLAREAQDATVKIYFRTDYMYRRNGVQLYTSTSRFSSYPGGQLCHNITGRANGTDIPDVVSVNCTGIWRYLMVYTQTANDDGGPVLDFGEIEVSVCYTGSFGLNCDKSCTSRQCVVSPPSCNRYNAECPSGGCHPGWTGSDCTEVCVKGTYGTACNMSCDNRKCSDSSFPCDPVTGDCTSGCLPGWNGTDCTQKCPTGSYGLNCKTLCSSRQCVSFSQICDHVTGNCSEGCKAGWMGADCMTVCSDGTYGANCDNNCSARQCRNQSSSCDRETGQCSPDGCLDAWKGNDCTIKCPGNAYGINCLSCNIRHCLGESDCPANGICSGGCKDGWTLPTCTQACSGGRYGPGCNYTCGNCANTDVCEHVTGNCPGDCEAGWQPGKCHQSCQGKKYGLNCVEDCGQCVGKCNTTDGRCPGACIDGYNGTLCKEKLQSDNPGLPSYNVTPAVAGAAAMFLIIVILVVIFTVYKRRRNHSPSEQKADGNRLPVAANVSSANESDKKEGVNVYVNVAMEQVESTGRVKSLLHGKPKLATQKPQSKVIENEDMEKEMLDEADPLPNTDYYNDIVDVIREIPVGDLEDTVQKIKHRKGGFEAEYNRLPTGFTASYDDSQKPENAGKNKFIGYYPYDHNRVRLSLLPDIPGSDYINASLMHSCDQRKTYIAAQAPNKKTVGDFWRMIWEHRCGRVIMLTGLVEKMKVKCYQYWPIDGVLETDHFRVEVEVTDTRANYTVRHFKVTSKESGQVRSTVQYHYTSWPDHGIPDTLALVNFIWMIRRTYRETGGPLLIHCSAGIGRTGTYMAVDSLLDQARGEGMVDVLGYVSVMRGQRKNMIQTKEQYECVFQCLVEMTKFGDTSMDVENFTTNYSSRGMDSMMDRKTLREIAQMTIMEDSNNTSPPQWMWVDGNQDFTVRIGPTLRVLRGYLQAVSPPGGLEKLLWKLVEENNVHHVVVLSTLKMDLFGDNGATKKYGEISLTTTDQTSLTSDLSMVTLKITTAGNSHNVKLFILSGSPTIDSMSSLLLDHAHLQLLSAEMSPVVLVHREPDRKPTVVFCIMGNILSSIAEDRRVDVIGHVRAFHMCCPDLDFTEQDIEKLLKFAKKYVQLTGTANTYANM